MARSALTRQTISISGITPSAAAANVDGNSFDNEGETFFHAINGGGGSITLTFQTPAKVGGVNIDNPTVVVGAGAEVFVGPFNPSIFNQPTGEVYVDYSGVTSLTVAAFKL